MTLPTSAVGIGARSTLGCHPVADVVGVDEPGGPEQATTGKATATSPLSGAAVVVVDGGTVVTVTPVDAVVPTSAEEPHPARHTVARTAEATAARDHTPLLAGPAVRDDLHMTTFDARGSPHFYYALGAGPKRHRCGPSSSGADLNAALCHVEYGSGTIAKVNGVWRRSLERHTKR